MPKVFHVGFPGLGGRRLVRAFLRSGYRVVHPAGGDAATDITYSMRSGARPLRRYADVHLFTDLESKAALFRPHLFAYREFAFLHQQFSDGYFILTTGDRDDWVARRLARGSGLYQRALATTFDVPEDAVPAILARVWDEHVPACLDHFKGYERFLHVDARRQTLDDVADFLRPDFRLDVGRPPARVLQPAGRPRATPVRVATPYDARYRSPDTVDEVVEFATRRVEEVSTGMLPTEFSGCYADWRGGDVVFNRRGRPARCAVDLSQRWPFLFDVSRNRKRVRTEGVLNQLWHLGAGLGAAVDMEDARRFGTAETGAPDQPVLTYTRLAGADNLVLWPLPGHHTPGAPNFPGAESQDMVAFEDKQDTVVWRGNLTGRALAELGPAGAGAEHVQRLVEELGTPRHARALEALQTVPRFRVTHRLQQAPGFDLGFTLGPSLRHLLDRPELAALARERLSYDDLYRNRYVLSLSGNDTGSNFLKALDSHCVVLKEEEPWQLFYTGQFLPWEHYVPVARGGGDIEDRLDWARSNPGACRAMSAAARETVRRLVHPGNRTAYLRGILSVYEERYRR